VVNILFTWELGGGLGHMIPARPLVEGLAARGHRLFVALRELAPAAGVFGHMGTSLLQAPFRHSRPGAFSHTPSFAHVLSNIGFGDDGELFALVSAWRNLIGFVRPSVIVFDHSPTALLAARHFPGVKKVVVGLGFFCPPDIAPWPALVAGPVDVGTLMEHETRVLATVNRLLARSKLPPLNRLGQLYGDVDDTFLQTFEELDHYPGRPDGTAYYGPVHSPGGVAPAWPDGEGPRVYAYLKNFPALPAVLGALAERGHRTVVYGDGLPAEVRRRFASPCLRFETRRLDLARVGAECGLAVHNANHGTLCQLLLSGRPMLQVPITLEQKVLARAVDALGASETVPARDADAGEVGRKLDALLGEPRYAEAARRFAAKYASFDPAEQVRRMVERVEGMMGKGASMTSRRTVVAG
jgi:UDP:flavonoid glycosyltransferase YjiC (YdhE family)